MLGNHRQRIFRLSSLLQDLSRDPKNLATLATLQQEILKSIRRTERRIIYLREFFRDTKRILSSQRLPKSEAIKIKAKLSRLKTLIKKNRWLIDIWRSFGDAIAFIYLDKWAIKPMMYNVSDVELKSHAGSVIGKPGQRVELALVKKLLNSGIPALLSDITNCIRHGDVCVLIGPDPFPIEVKSSKNRNARTDRQLENIKAIHQYLATDKAANTRGAGDLIRISLPIAEIDYRSLYDTAINEALNLGHFRADPEPGIRLIALAYSTPDILDECLSGLQSARLWSLNEMKNNEGWGVYYPPVLSIRTPENLFAFLNGNVSLFIVHDLEMIKRIGAKKGVKFEITDDPIWQYQFSTKSKNSKEPVIRKMSSHFITRMAVELLSWNWFFLVERRWANTLQY